MKTSLQAAVVLAISCGALLASGCATRSDGRRVNTRQPGPAIGTGVGIAAGAVAGNAAGAVVGAGEGFVGAAGTAFNSDRRVVRSWRTETTSDGRTIRVPVEIEVDAYGRPYADLRQSTSGSAAPERGPR
jgi:uncharacterized protein (DUF58 family)